MKLLSIQNAINMIESWVDIPITHELIHSGVFCSLERGQVPFYKVELEWNKKGEPERYNTGLVNKHTIRAELDAITGEMIAFYRHDHRADSKRLKQEIDNTLYESIYPHVCKWIDKLDLKLNPIELCLKRKDMINDNLYQLDYGRQYNNVPFSSYQNFSICLNKNYELINLHYTWDQCNFSINGHLIPPEVFKQRFDYTQLSIYYIVLLQSEHPYYTVDEDEFNAFTGKLICADKGELIEAIDLQTNVPQRNQQIELVKRPLISKRFVDKLRINDYITDLELFTHQPFFLKLNDMEKTKARDIVASYLKQYYAEEPYQFTVIRKEQREDSIEVRKNLIEVHIQRTLYEIPIIGGGIYFYIDRDDWQLIQVIDALKLRGEIQSNDIQFREAKIGNQEVWGKLEEKISLKLHYKIDNASVNETKSAILVYTLDCDWICDAVTGELVELT